MSGCGWRIGGLDIWRTCGQARVILVKAWSQILESAVRAEIVEQTRDKVLEPLLLWSRPTLVEAIGPNDLNAVVEFGAAIDDIKSRVHATLESVSDDDIAALHAVIEDRRNLAGFAALKPIFTEISSLVRKMPPTIASGFGAVSLRADFSYWRTMPELTLHEALMLSVGLEPTIFSERRLGELSNRKPQKSLWSALEYLLARRQVFRRFYPMGPAGYMSMTFPALERAIETFGIKLDREFRDALATRSSRQEPACGPDASSKNMSNQERDTLLKLIAAMACEQYSFDPRKQRSDALKNIQEDLERTGISMDQKTVRKWVRLAVDLIPKTYWE